MNQELTQFTSRIIKEYTVVTLFLSIGWITTIFVLGFYINYLKDKVEKLTSDNSESTPLKRRIIANEVGSKKLDK